MENQEAPKPLPAKLFAALAKAQAKFPAIPKNREVTIKTRENGSYRFRYADLETVIASTRPSMSENGLAVLQAIVGDDLQTILAHESGESFVSVMKLPAMHPSDPKSYGAAISYLRRYAYQSLVCVASDDDLDEDGQGAGYSQPQQQAQPQQRPSYSSEQFDANFPTWKQLIESGKKKHDDIITMVESKAPLSAEQKKKINAIKAPQGAQQ